MEKSKCRGAWTGDVLPVGPHVLRGRQSQETHQGMKRLSQEGEGTGLGHRMGPGRAGPRPSLTNLLLLPSSVSLGERIPWPSGPHAAPGPALSCTDRPTLPCTVCHSSGKTPIHQCPLPQEAFPGHSFHCPSSGLSLHPDISWTCAGLCDSWLLPRPHITLVAPRRRPGTLRKDCRGAPAMCHAFHQVAAAHF